VTDQEVIADWRAKLAERKKTPEYHFESIRCAHVREELGGVPAAHSHLAIQAIQSLLEMGWTADQIVDRLNREHG
jgi:hypothetical protein